MTDTPETMIGLFAKKLNAKLADEYRSMRAKNEQLRKAAQAVLWEATPENRQRLQDVINTLEG